MASMHVAFVSEITVETAEPLKSKHAFGGKYLHFSPNMQDVFICIHPHRLRGISPLCHVFLPQTDGHFRLPSYRYVSLERLREANQKQLSVFEK